MKDVAESPSANAKAKSPKQAESPGSSADPAESIADSDDGHGDETHFEIVRKSSKVHAVAEIAKLDMGDVKLELAEDQDVQMGGMGGMEDAFSVGVKGSAAAAAKSVVKIKQVNLQGKPVDQESLKK